MAFKILVHLICSMKFFVNKSFDLDQDLNKLVDICGHSCCSIGWKSGERIRKGSMFVIQALCGMLMRHNKFDQSSEEHGGFCLN